MNGGPRFVDALPYSKAPNIPNSRNTYFKQIKEGATEIDGARGHF